MNSAAQIDEIGERHGNACQVIGSTPDFSFSARYNVKTNCIESISVYPKNASKLDAKRIALELIEREPSEHFV